MCCTVASIQFSLKSLKKQGHLEGAGVDGRIMLKVNVYSVAWMLSSVDSEQGPASGFLKLGHFLDWLSHCQVLKKNSAL